MTLGALSLQGISASFRCPLVTTEVEAIAGNRIGFHDIKPAVIARTDRNSCRLSTHGAFASLPALSDRSYPEPDPHRLRIKPEQCGLALHLDLHRLRRSVRIPGGRGDLPAASRHPDHAFDTRGITD